MKNKKIITVVGARPQFIKTQALSIALDNKLKCGGHIEELLVHTGQHFDANMSEVFFTQLQLKKPFAHLDVAGGSHARMTGLMMIELEKIFYELTPSAVVVYGDTNSTLAASLAAAKIHIPVLHIEAGLRSFNMHMPEEINRILTDKISSRLYCPTHTAVKNLNLEGHTRGILNVGDVMLDVCLNMKEQASTSSNFLLTHNLQANQYVLCTVHRAENTDNKSRLHGILTALQKIALTNDVVFPIHPRTKQSIIRFGFEELLSPFICTEPLGYLDMLQAESNCSTVLTDSGGVQKEAYFFGKRCITLRDQTEWVETVEAGWNIVVGTDPAKILDAWNSFNVPIEIPQLFGSGQAGALIADDIYSMLIDEVSA